MRKPFDILAEGLLFEISGGGGIRTPMENTGKNNTSKVRGTPALRMGQMPNIVAHAMEALNDLIEWWPSLSLATQNRIHEIAKAEAASDARNASDKRGAK